MDWQTFHSILIIIQRMISLVGILVIVSGVIVALSQYMVYFFSRDKATKKTSPITMNTIRLTLGQTLILGLEFIVASDLIGTTTTRRRSEWAIWP